MDIEKHLILLKGEDKTEAISSCAFKDGKWKIRFENGKNYEYHESNVLWLKDPTVNRQNVVVFHNGKPLSGVESIHIFSPYIRICYGSGYKKVYSEKEIRMEQNSLSTPSVQGLFSYLHQLAGMVSVKDEEDSSFLSKQYKKLNHISPDSILSKYLALATPKDVSEDQPLPVFPFGFNLSQQTATERALSQQISVIEGPPGTGKTQTILNIIANIIMNGKTVAVVSNNNAATANVMEKLQKYGTDYLAAYLGNKVNKERFFSEQSKEYPDMSLWRMDPNVFSSLQEQTKANGAKLKEMLKFRNNLAALRQELSALSLESKYFHEYYYQEVVAPYRSLSRNSSSKVLALWLDYQKMALTHNGTPLKYKLKYLFSHGITSFSFFKNSNEDIIMFLQRMYYVLKLKELESEISTLTRKLEQYRFEESMKEYSADCMKLFKAYLAEKAGDRQQRQIFTQDALWKGTEFDSFSKEYPLILSTTHSLRSCIAENVLFDYVIMDEASQVDIVTGSLAMACARNAVIVGDLQQLPNVVPTEVAQETDRLFYSEGFHRAFRYSEHSMLSSITTLFEGIPKTLLREHYRCHPKIIGFCNQKFYNNQLILMSEDDGQEQDALVLYKLAEGNHARGNYNQREIDVIMKEVFPEQNIAGTQQSVGIISPYRLQVEKLQKVTGDLMVEVDTVHKFQGREKDIVILSTVVNEVNDFVNNPNLINVAVSRAVHKLIVIVSNNEKNQNSNLGELERYINYNNFAIIPSEIYSVFDLLYSRYSEKLLAIMKSVKQVSAYKSENLMHYVIEKVLSEPEFRNLGFVMHQPLKMLIRNLDRLSEAEKRYAMNILTHTDFLIFNKLDKKPVLVIEVDGYKYHSGDVQKERDKMKDDILGKYGIPIARFRTDESEEESRLRRKLHELVG
ncbi:AAA domain-containing protein [Paenibacillus sp. CF384]|uniref:AAA domain-containing protein n=1 Tax=Paenibacillus sp. CF384 TaxID=1884382 RepID=UPI00089B2A7F|nr:AAA domain-containing protein [Paenibacillus sp. CF384]SDW71371.1 Protein of unknown function [Paenibacillus sp. CF384]